MIGQAGLTEAVLKEIELALDTHELLKIKIRAEREERKVIQQHICTETSAELMDIKEGRISVGSPIARAMIGKEEEDVITVKTPGGEVDYEILTIQYI
jgi:transcription elongation GreA/GreB family factor